MGKIEKMEPENKYRYTPLPEPIPITEQVWPEGTLPLVHTRTMTFMHENYIRDCIDGILLQKTTFPVQVLIHDDASTDKTAEIVKEYEHKYPRLIKAYYQKENSYSKPDKLERRAEFFKWRIGKYEALCEGDDYWTEPLKLQKQVDVLEADSSVAVCCHHVSVVDSLGEPIESRYEPTIPGTVAGLPHGALVSGFGHIVRENFMRTCSAMFRVTSPPAWEHPILARTIQGDWPLHLLHARSGSIACIPQNMACYREHQGGVWSAKSASERVLGHLETNLKLLFCDTFNEDQRQQLAYGIPYAIENLERAGDLDWLPRCLAVIEECCPDGDAPGLLQWLILLGRAERDRQHLEEQMDAIKSSRPYRLGIAALAPFRGLRKIARALTAGKRTAPPHP